MMQHVASIALSLIVLAGGLASAAEPDWTPLVVDWRTAEKSPADVSFLLQAPAGKDGFIRIAQGHLVQPGGRRFRIWGANATGAATVPEKAHAAILARRLAQYGINCVRFHFLDSRAPAGLIDARRKDSRALDPAQLDRLDFFIAELKQQGIYANLNLNVGRVYQPEDGVKDYELLGFAKALTYFDPRLLELQKEHARSLLTHRNPYTGNEYRREPAVAIVEMVNENSLVESWFSGRLLGKNTTRNPGTWTDIPASYEKDLTARYNAWLRERLSKEELDALAKEAGVAAGQPIPRLQPRQFAAASQKRFTTEASFYVEIERRYFAEMGRYLKQELGVQPLLVGTSDHNHGQSGYPLLSSTSQLDILDGHVYWQHPRYLTNKSGRHIGFEIANSPMVDEPLHSTPVQLSRSAVAGKPYTVSEVGHPFPAEYACEGIPILAAYGALQDWDGIFWYTLGHRDAVAAGPSAIGHFDLYPDPVKMAQLAAGAIVFLRADVRPSARTVLRSYTRDQVLSGIRLSRNEGPFFTPGFPLSIPLIHATRISSFDGPATLSFPDPGQPDPIVSDTGELAWYHAAKGAGLVAINTPRSQALVGFLKANPRDTENLAAEMETPFCALTLSAMDDQPIARCGKMLLTAGARVRNSGMQWNARRTSLENWGHPPTEIEPAIGRVVLRKLETARAVSAQPLDGAGRALGSAIPATRTDAGWVIPLGKPATPWYVVLVAR
jgi:hypothetical protein